MIRYLHTICTHLRKIEENKRYYLKRKYYLWAWKSRGMYMKRNRMQIIENQIFATHNLEVPGSSPGWSTKKADSIKNTAFFLYGNLRLRVCCFSGFSLKLGNC